MSWPSLKVATWEREETSSKSLLVSMITKADEWDNSERSATSMRAAKNVIKLDKYTSGGAVDAILDLVKHLDDMTTKAWNDKGKGVGGVGVGKPGEVPF